MNTIFNGPPWVVHPDKAPYEPFWRQGNPEFELYTIWMSFWEQMTDEQKAEYLHDWNAPIEWKDWLESRKEVEP